MYLQTSVVDENEKFVLVEAIDGGTDLPYYEARERRSGAILAFGFDRERTYAAAMDGPTPEQLQERALAFSALQSLRQSCLDFQHKR